MRFIANKIVWGKLRDATTAISEDATHSAIEKLDSFRGESKFSTWFYAIVMNQIKMWLRKERMELVTLTSREADLVGCPFGDDNLWLSLLDDEKKLVAARLEGQTDKEIARSMGVSRATVTRLWRKMRERLRS